MAYCGVSDVRRRTPTISALDVPDSVYQTYILEAGDVIDSYLSKYYSVPFITTPLTIKIMCADIAAYYAMRDYPDKIFEDDLTRIETSYKLAIDDLQSGKMLIPGVEPISKGTVTPFVYKVNSDQSRWEDQ